MDLNGDGIDDLISGQYSPGIVNVWFGSKKGFSEKITLPEKADESGKTTAMMSTANFVDWDGDGDLDMIVGDVTGGIKLNINNGTQLLPKFGVRQPLMLNGKPMKGAGKTDPMAVDWDDDGDLDILAGTEAGDVFFYRRQQDGSFAQPVSALTGKPRTDISYSSVKKGLKSEGVDIGYRLRIDVADWDGDGHLDLLVGNCRRVDQKTIGEVRVYLRNKPAVPGSKP